LVYFFIVPRGFRLELNTAKRKRKGGPLGSEWAFSFVVRIHS